MKSPQGGDGPAQLVIRKELLVFPRTVPLRTRCAGAVEAAKFGPFVGHFGIAEQFVLFDRLARI